MTGGDPVVFAMAVAFLGALAVWFTFKFIKVRWYKLGAGLIIGFLLLGVYGIGAGLIQLTAVAAVFLVVVSALWFLCWVDCRKRLQRIVDFADPMLPSFDVIASFAEMGRIDSGWLTSKQLVTLNRYRVFCHIALGNCSVAKTLLNEGDFEPVFKHFALGVIAEGAGDYKQSRVELDRAFASNLEVADPFTVLQLEHNRAIAHINEGQFRVADGDLERVRAKVKAGGLCNKGFLNLLYENLVLNKTRLGLPNGGAAEGWALIDEYAKTLKSDDGFDRSTFFNLKLLFLRQLGAGRKDKADLFEGEISDTLNDGNLAEEQRTVAMASLGRIAWADGLDPTRVLDYFGTCDFGLDGLRPSNRIYVFKNLSIMLGALSTSHPGLAKIAGIVASYYENGIQHDLDLWERELPSEAIKLRVQILRERAALCQAKGDDARAAGYLEEAILLLERSLLIMDALEVRLELVKCLIPFEPEEAKRHLPAIEERLTSFDKQPALGYPYYELSLCYGLLGFRHECRAAYEKAASFNTSMDHYVPGVRGEVAMASFCARFYLMLDVLDSADRVRPLLRTDEGRLWLDAYPDGVSSLSLVILTGRFFGYEGCIPVARRTTVIGDSLLLACFWLAMPEFDLAFDPGIKGTVGERGGVFLHSRHPLVAPDSNFEVLMRRQGLEPLPLEGKPCDESEMGEGERIAVADVLDALDIVCKNKQPTIEELGRCYSCGCLYIPIE